MGPAGSATGSGVPRYSTLTVAAFRRKRRCRGDDQLATAAFELGLDAVDEDPIDLHADEVEIETRERGRRDQFQIRLCSELVTRDIDGDVVVLHVVTRVAETGEERIADAGRACPWVRSLDDGRG